MKFAEKVKRVKNAIVRHHCVLSLCTYGQEEDDEVFMVCNVFYEAEDSNIICYTDNQYLYITHVDSDIVYQYEKGSGKACNKYRFIHVEDGWLS